MASADGAERADFLGVDVCAVGVRRIFDDGNPEFVGQRDALNEAGRVSPGDGQRRWPACAA
jgi:hypothetical protein